MKKITKKMMSAMLAAVLAVSTPVSVPVMNNTALAAEESQLETVKEWTSQADYAAWYYGDGWEGGYQGSEYSKAGLGYDENMDALKVAVDYSKDKAQTWSQMAVCIWDEGLDLTGATQAELDLIYDSAKLDGGLTIKAYSNAGIDQYVAVNTENAETAEGTNLSKVHVTIPFAAPVSKEASDFAICLIGNETSYKGNIYLKDIKIMKAPSEDIDVNSTIPVKDTTELTLAKLSLTSEVTLADAEATADTKAVYAYLDAVGKSEYVIYGHQDDTWHKAGDLLCKNGIESDTYDITGSLPGVMGVDTLALLGNEYSAERYNNEIIPITGEVPLPETMEGNLQAIANISNQAIEAGSIITLSSHMPNFSVVEEKADYKEGDPTYMKYDFSGYTPNTLSGDPVNQILPGGKYNEKFNAFLDVIAAYAKKVDGTILFRPFHENTGSWFWWGAAFCDAATYKSVYKYTVEYLRDEKDVHNMLYLYGPSSEAASMEEYEVRYPGDEYVDMVGFDMYNIKAPADNSAWYDSFEKELQIVNDFAKTHNKLVAVTETGAANDPQPGENQTALLKTGNEARDWYNKVMEIVSKSDASYYLLWANFSKTDGYYTPYVDSVNEDGTLHGHELLDDFIDFFNRQESLFAVNQKDVLDAVDGDQIQAVSAMKDAAGYITAPISGSRILEPTTLQAKVNGEYSEKKVKAEFILHGNTDIKVKAKSKVKKGETCYSAELSQKNLDKLGESVGTIDLVLNGVVKDTVNAVFNIQPPKEDPYMIDDFENYYGQETLLTKSWSANKATGNTIALSLVQDADKVFSGKYALKFDYNETSDGWAGATISKTVDWSDCNALDFYTVPDGKNQLVVVQLSAGGKVYETYLNLYEEYANAEAGTLLHVTIPFSKFVSRDEAGKPAGGLSADCASVTSFGLWVNAIPDSPAVADGMVAGTIYYDHITATQTENTEAVIVPAK
ncbi:MAG: glycosyl hydrolase [Lachnospiraceae bacterium]|nr:glycosyl hydrolase [Lachnospiraceae bacterium]